MKWQKIVVQLLASELIIVGIISTDDELVARLPSPIEYPHTAHPISQIPEYLNDTIVVSSTASIDSSNTLTIR